MTAANRSVTRLLAAILLISALPASASRAAEPSLVDELVGAAGFARADVEAMGNTPLVRELDAADPSRESAWAGIVRLRTDGAALADALGKPAGAALPQGALARGRFSDPPQASDVAAIEFSASELEELADCKAAACKFKVGRAGIESLSAIDWTRPDAGARFTAAFRREVLAYVEAYRAKGDAALIVYADKSTPSPLAGVLRSLVEKFAAFRRHAPALSSYLLSYPDGRRSSFADAVVWQIADFGYRPTLVVDHLVVDRATDAPGAAVLVAAKTIYANHYLAARIQMGAVLDGPTALGAPGHFLLVIDRIAFDDALNGFKRKLLGSGLRDSLAARLELLRSLADGGR